MSKESVTSLKGLVKKPASPVTINMMNEASKGPLVNKVSTKGGTKPLYKLSDLLAESDPNALIPNDIKAWINLKPVGKEII